jgi:hypothetical protein
MGHKQPTKANNSAASNKSQTLNAALNKSVYPQLLKPWVNHQYIPQHLFLTVNRLGLQLYDLVLVTNRSKRCR